MEQWGRLRSSPGNPSDRRSSTPPRLLRDPIVTTVSYWNRERETMPREALAALQLKGLRFTVAQALKTPFYRQRLTAAGIDSPDRIRSLDDLRRLPFTTKDDLRTAYPRGLLAVPGDEVIRLHTSSGTTGTPIVVYHTRSDIANWTELVARCIVATGAGRGD